MSKNLTAFLGSWTATSSQQLYANSMVTCTDTLTLDPDGRAFRQFKSANYVFKSNGAKEIFHINVTVIGSYNLNGGVLSFSDLQPRLDDNSFSYEPGPDEKDVDDAVIMANGRGKLEGKVAEVLMNRAMECRKHNIGRMPVCHAYVDSGMLYMKWSGVKTLDKFTRCDEPVELDRKREPMAVDAALKAPETRFINAIHQGDCYYLNNAVLYTPCTAVDDGHAIQFKPLIVEGNQFLIAFSDIHRMKSSSFTDGVSWRPAYLTELVNFKSLFAGICLNPSHGHSVGIPFEMIDDIVDGTWTGISEEATEE